MAKKTSNKKYKMTNLVCVERYGDIENYQSYIVIYKKLFNSYAKPMPPFYSQQFVLIEKRREKLSRLHKKEKNSQTKEKKNSFKGKKFLIANPMLKN